MKSYCYELLKNFMFLYIGWKAIRVCTGQIVSQGMFFLGSATKWSKFDRYLVKLDITRLIHVSCFLFGSFRCCYTFFFDGIGWQVGKLNSIIPPRSESDCWKL